MGTKQKQRVRRSESEWRGVFEQFERSGKSRSAFCRAAGIPSSTFDVWARRLRAGGDRAEFVEVQPAVEPGVRWWIEIAFPDGTTARVRG